MNCDIEKINKSFDGKVVKCEIDNDGASVYIYDKKLDFGVWFDYWLEDSGDIAGDWNKYIFVTNQDFLVKQFQEAVDEYNFPYNFDLCNGIGFEYLERKNIFIWDDKQKKYIFNGGVKNE